MLVVSDAGERRLIRWAFKSTEVLTGIQVGLFKNDFTPIPGMTLASFTEADFAGYARGSFDRDDWSDPITNAQGKGQVSGPDQDYTSTDASEQTLHGYFVIDPSDDTLLWAERFASPRTIGEGQSITIRPRFTGVSESDLA